MAASEAFNRALGEIERIWARADHLDSKILQILGIVSAGSLAAAAIVAQSLPLSVPPSLGVAMLLAAGVLCVLLFAAFATRAAVMQGFTGPLDVKSIADRPELLGNDKDFEREAFPAIESAFSTCLATQDKKWCWFAASLWVLFASLVCFAVAGGLWSIDAWGHNAGAAPRHEFNMDSRGTFPPESTAVPSNVSER